MISPANAGSIPTQGVPADGLFPNCNTLSKFGEFVSEFRQDFILFFISFDKTALSPNLCKIFSLELSGNLKCSKTYCPNGAVSDAQRAARASETNPEPARKQRWHIYCTTLYNGTI
jgi:hypothetical protein